jgi:Lon protease-like protein
VLYYFAGEMAINQTLNNVLLKHFPEECRARAAEESTAPQTAPDSTGQRRVLPLFVMTSVFPGQRQSLNIFEPRYRLLVRRVMMGSRRLGMIPHGGSDGVPLRLGTEVEIVECEAQPDGRFHIEVVGLQRFTVEEDWEQDGYRVASVSYVRDEPPEDCNVTSALVEGTERLVQQIVDNLSRDGVLCSGRAMDYLYLAGEKPARSEAEKFSFWAASLAPLQVTEVKACLRTRVTGARLQIVIDSLKKGLNPAAGGCTVL